MTKELLDELLNFLDKTFPAKYLEQFRSCLTDIEEGRYKHGKIIISIQEGRIIAIHKEEHFDR